MDTIALRNAAHGLVGGVHLLPQPLVYRRPVPVISICVLHLLKVRHGDPAGVTEEIWEYEYAALEQDLVCTGSGRSVRQLCHESGTHLGSIVGADRVLQGSGNQHIDVELEKLGVGDHRGPILAIADHGAIVLFMDCKRLVVEPILAIDAAPRVGYGDDSCPKHLDG